MGKIQQKEHKTLKSVIISHFRNKQQIYGRMNDKSLNQLEGTGLLFTNKRTVVVSTFKNGKPDGITKTIDEL
tara:strand:+ start:109 stop:324 length:216 start_codon:yes stop_codon:yes gene_type:complete